MIDFRQQPQGYEQGIYDMPFEQYAAIPALNSSKLKKMRRSPLHFKTALEMGDQPVSPQLQRTFDKGKAFDIFVLDGGLEVLKNQVEIEPDVNRNTKIYKEWKAGVASGKLILTQSEYLGVIAMASSAYRKNQFVKLFEKGNPHRVIIWQDPPTGLWCKAEIDWITHDGIVVDLKSTADAGFWFFSRNARKLGYPNQGAHYLGGLTVVTGYKHNDFLLAAVEVDPPYESQVFNVGQEMLFQAAEENAEYMAQIKHCLEADDWPGYPDKIMSLESGQLLWDDEIEETMDDPEYPSNF